MSAKGVNGARRALALASDPGKFLSTVQIGITLIGVLSGAFSGATLGLRLASWLVEAGLSPALAETVGVGVVVAVITYASLIIGELVPKQIALRDPEAVAVKVAPAMALLAKISIRWSGCWIVPARCCCGFWAIERKRRRRSVKMKFERLLPRRNCRSPGAGRKGNDRWRDAIGDLAVGAVMTPRHEVDSINWPIVPLKSKPTF